MLNDTQLERVLGVCQRTNEPLDARKLVEILREQKVGLSGAGLVAALEQLQNLLFGLGPLEELLSRPDVTDVLVNSATEIWFEDQRGLQLSEVSFASDDSLWALTSRLVLRAGAQLDQAHPFVSVVLPTGVRLHAVIAPICESGVRLSLRKPSSSSLTLTQLHEMATFDERALELLRDLLTTRATFLICGATGSGKTTLLRALLNEVEPAQRIVILEDTPELNISRPNTVSLTARAANADGFGAITLSHLVQESLRMRPDRIAVGEVRGSEVLDLLRAMNTGHLGSCGTLHANSAADVLPRLSALCQLGGCSYEAAKSLIAAAVSVIIEIQQDAHRHRRLVNISRLRTDITGALTLDPLYELPALA